MPFLARNECQQNANKHANNMPAKFQQNVNTMPTKKPAKPKKLLTAHPALIVTDSTVVTVVVMRDNINITVTRTIFEVSNTVFLNDTFEMVYCTIIHVSAP